MNISEMDNIDVLLAWQSSKLSTRKFAKKHGVSIGIVAGKIRRASSELQELSKHAKQGIKDNQSDINNRKVTARGRRIKTLDDLIDQCKIDLDVWVIPKHEINKWEVGRKHTEVDLVINNGVMTGHKKDSGMIFVEPLFQVTAWMIKREPELIYPIVQPISITIESQPPVIKTKLSERKSSLIIPDAQIGFRKDIYTGELFPYHDRKSLSIVLQFVQAYHFDNIIVIGDWMDFAEWSDKFIRSPDSIHTTQPAVIEGSWWLSKIRQAAPDADIDLIEGNHDKRIETLIIKNLPFAFNLKAADEIHLAEPLSVERLLGLPKLNINYVGKYPKGEVWLGNSIRIIHSEIARTEPGATARIILKDANHSTIFGHIHSFERLSKVVYDRNGAREIEAICPGGLCDPLGDVPAKKARQQWTKGFTIAHYDDDNYHLENVKIINDKAYYRDMVFQPAPIKDDLIADTGWNF